MHYSKYYILLKKNFLPYSKTITRPQGWAPLSSFRVKDRGTLKCPLRAPWAVGTTGAGCVTVWLWRVMQQRDYRVTAARMWLNTTRGAHLSSEWQILCVHYIHNYAFYPPHSVLRLGFSLYQEEESWSPLVLCPVGFVNFDIDVITFTIFTRTFSLLKSPITLLSEKPSSTCRLY